MTKQNYTPNKWIKENWEFLERWVENSRTINYSPSGILVQEFIQYADSNKMKHVDSAMKRLLYEIIVSSVYNYPSVMNVPGHPDREIMFMEGFYYKFGRMPTAEDQVQIVWLTEPEVIAHGGDDPEVRPYLRAICYPDFSRVRK